MNIFELLGIIVIVLFGIVISWKDLKMRKIYNRDLLLLFLLGLSLSLVTINFKFLPNFVLNLFLSMVIGFALWKINFWEAGDGKLFVACSLFLPLKTYAMFFPSQLLLINFFVLGFLFWLPSLILRTRFEDKKKAFKLAFGFRNIVTAILALFGLMWIVSSILSFFDLSNLFLILIFAFILFYALRKIVSQKIMYLIFILLCVLRLFFDSSIYSLSFLKQFILIVPLVLTAYALGVLSMHISFELRPLKKLKEGDIPMGAMRKKSKREIDLDKIMNKYFGHSVFRILEGGFNKKDIEIAKKLKDEIDGFVVKKHIPFAPLFFITTIITIFIGENIFSFVAGFL